MRIITFCIILSCLTVLTQSVDEHRPKKKEKRNLQYSVSHHYSGPSYRLERRISNGPQHPSHYSPSPYHPGLPRPYRKGRPYTLPPPPYAVQMEPLIHYSQRDPLYDTNTLSPNTDHGQDLTDTNHLTDPIDRGGSGDTIYIPHKPLIKVVEKPVYIKEPEPIIEIIIKESNITLPPPPTEAPPPPQKKKKEEVQVFYVKYKKNPNGYGKDSVIYDKPIPAISPTIPDEPEPEEEWKEPEPGYGSYSNEVTELPRPSTTLRTIIKPDSEIYHSPGNNVKVTFGKEGFDYDKRSSKPEDYPGPRGTVQEDQYPKARQLSSFSNVYFKRPAQNYHQASTNEYRSEARPPQSYHPFNNISPSSNQFNSRSPNREFNNRSPSSYFPEPKYPFQSPPYTKPSNSPSSSPSFSFPPTKSSFPDFSHTISHPPPPQFQSESRNRFSSSQQPSHHQFQTQSQFSDVPPPHQRKPVPYTPFENLRPSQSAFSQPLPSSHDSHHSFSQSQPSHSSNQYQSLSSQQPEVKTTIQFRPETRVNIQQQPPANRPAPSFAEGNSQQQLHRTVSNQKPQSFHQQQSQHQQQQIQYQQQQIHHQQQKIQHQQPQIRQHQQFNGPEKHQEHLNNIRTTQNFLPPGGELVASLPKFEQHLVVNSANNQQSSQPVFASSTHNQENVNRANKQVKSQNNNDVPQQYLQRSNAQSFINNQQVNHNQAYQHQIFSERTTPRISSYSSSRIHSSSTTEPTTTTTKEPEKPSTTTKDPKILEAQLPDEVPDELREQLLSSGILNNADISILDYDKVGDIPLSALPADQLANFYNAGGAAQLAAAGSEPAPQVAALTSRQYQTSPQDQEMTAEESEVREVTAKPSEEGVEMKVVRYDPESDKGQRIQQAYIHEDAKQVDPVVLNDSSYNQYLPLKVNGTQFPIPDVDELKGKQISSVVVLAPISYQFSSNRQTREANPGSEIDFVKNEPLKELLANPTLENYKKFLDHEDSTVSAKQSVILLIAGSNEDPKAEKEIFMYDIGTKTVNKLNGELSSAFVEAAEANSSDEPESSASEIVETRILFDTSKATEDLVSEGSETKLEDANK